MLCGPLVLNRWFRIRVLNLSGCVGASSAVVTRYLATSTSRMVGAVARGVAGPRSVSSSATLKQTRSSRCAGLGLSRWSLIEDARSLGCANVSPAAIMCRRDWTAYWRVKAAANGAQGAPLTRTRPSLSCAVRGWSRRVLTRALGCGGNVDVPAAVRLLHPPITAFEWVMRVVCRAALKLRPGLHSDSLTRQPLH